MRLRQCIDCGSSGWTIYELKNGLCPSCQEDENYYDEDYFECCSECNLDEQIEPVVSSLSLKE